MAKDDKPHEDLSSHQHVEHIEADDIELAAKPTAVDATKGADLAAQLIGHQHVEISEEDVSPILCMVS